MNQMAADDSIKTRQKSNVSRLLLLAQRHAVEGVSDEMRQRRENEFCRIRTMPTAPRPASTERSRNTTLEISRKVMRFVVFCGNRPASAARMRIDGGFGASLVPAFRLHWRMFARGGRLQESRPERKPLEPDPACTGVGKRMAWQFICPIVLSLRRIDCI
jgi:hypothetical protein